MSERVIRHKDWTEETTHRLWFDTDPTGRGRSGYSFDCDPAGKVDPATLAQVAAENLAGLLAAGRRGEIKTETHRRRVPGLMRCDCGRKLEMWDHRDIYCGCGRGYTSGGYLLAPRSQWGEETGETAADYDAGVAEGEASAFERALSHISDRPEDSLDLGPDDRD